MQFRNENFCKVCDYSNNAYILHNYFGPVYKLFNNLLSEKKKNSYIYFF